MLGVQMLWVQMSQHRCGSWETIAVWYTILGGKRSAWFRNALTNQNTHDFNAKIGVERCIRPQNA